MSAFRRAHGDTHRALPNGWMLGFVTARSRTRGHSTHPMTLRFRFLVPLFDFPAIEAFRIAVRDEAGLVGRKVGQPATVLLHGALVGGPALVDPGVGTEQKTVGMACKQIPPFRRYATAIADAAAIGQFCPKRRGGFQHLPHARGGPRE